MVIKEVNLGKKPNCGWWMREMEKNAFLILVLNS